MALDDFREILAVSPSGYNGELYSSLVSDPDVIDEEGEASGS